MPKLIKVANKLLSLRGAITFTDEHDQPVFEAKRELTFLAMTWRLYKGSTQVATISKGNWAWMRGWEIESALGNFVIRRNLWSWTPQLQVIGGSFDGAAIGGSLFHRNVEILMRGKLIGKAPQGLLSLRGWHAVEILDQSEEGILFTAIMMVAMRLDRNSLTAGSIGSV